MCESIVYLVADFVVCQVVHHNFVSLDCSAVEKEQHRFLVLIIYRNLFTRHRNQSLQTINYCQIITYCELSNTIKTWVACVAEKEYKITRLNNITIIS